MKNYYTKALLLIAGYCFLSSPGTIEAKPSYREYWSLHQKLFTQHEDKAYYQTLNENFKKSNAKREDYLNRFPEYAEAQGSNRTKIKKKLTEDGEGKALDDVYRKAIDDIDYWLVSMEPEYAVFYAEYREIPLGELTAGSPVPATESAPQHDVYFVMNDLPYTSDDTSRRLDVYVPSDFEKQKNPALIFVHGGGFRGGDKSVSKKFGEAFASRGFVTVVINYRLHLNSNRDQTMSCSYNMAEGLRPEGFHPELRNAVQMAAEDVRSAAAWLKYNVEQFNVSVSDINLMGGSAGAMSVLYAQFGSFADQSDWFPKIHAIVSLWGGLEDQTLISRVDSPAMLLIHGDEDPIINVSFSKRIAEQCNLVGVESELLILEGEGHAQYSNVLNNYLDDIIQFLE